MSMTSKAADTDKVTERELRNRAIAFEAMMFLFAEVLMHWVSLTTVRTARL